MNRERLQSLCLVLVFCPLLFWIGWSRHRAATAAGGRDAGTCLNCRSRAETWDSLPSRTRVVAPRQPAQGDGYCDGGSSQSFAVCGEAPRYDADGWKTPPGPPPGGAFQIDGTTRWSNHCGNTFTVVTVGADGERQSIIYEDRPCR